MTTTPDTVAGAQPAASDRTARPAATPHENDFTVALNLEGDYVQTVDFGLPNVPLLTVDEPPPLGGGAGPNPSRLLASAVGSCLTASLTFCMRKARVDVRGVRTTVRGSLVRNERGRLRVAALHVRLEPVVPADQHDRVPRCLELFEDFCVVTASVRQGLPVTVDVEPVSPLASP